jgi:dihydroorotate dehydrogenase
MTIDLAPHNPYGLSLRSPVMIAPGCANALRHPDPEQIGAIVTRTARIRSTGMGQSRWGAVPAGVVFERLATISFRSLVQAEAKRWVRSTIPVVLSLLGAADELAELAAQLETLEGVAGVMVQSDASDPVAAVAAVRAQTPLPLLAVVPRVADAQPGVGVIAAELVAAGADTLVASAYPRGCVVIDGAVVDGLVIGPTLMPWTLQAVADIAATTSVPIVALGGVADARLAQLCLQAGATALLIDGALYGDPAAPQHIATALQRKIASEAASA